MTYRVEISLGALQDTEDAYQWIKAHSLEAADQWYDGLLQAVIALENFPLRCPLAPESHDLGKEIRQLLYGRGRHSYRLLFTVFQDLQTNQGYVHIHHIRHSARRRFRADDLGSD